MIIIVVFISPCGPFIKAIILTWLSMQNILYNVQRNTETPTHLYLKFESVCCNTSHFSTQASRGLIHTKQRITLNCSLSLSLSPAWSDDSIVCHCLPASPWVIASPDTRLLVPLTHPNAQEIKCSVEVIKRVNPGCVLYWWLGCCGGRYYHIKSRLRGSQPSTPTLHLI